MRNRTFFSGIEQMRHPQLIFFFQMGLYFHIFFGCIIDESKISVAELCRIRDAVNSDYSYMSHKDGKYYVCAKSIDWIKVSAMTPFFSKGRMLIYGDDDKEVLASEETYQKLQSDFASYNPDIRWIRRGFKSPVMCFNYVIECRVAFIKQVREAVIAWLLCAPRLLPQKDLHKHIGLMIMATKFDRIWKPIHPRPSKSSEPIDQ